MCNRAQIHDFLRIRFGKHGKAGLTAGIHVGMITENVQCLSRDCTSGYMEDTGKEFTSDLVHIGDHQKKSLRSGIGGRQSTCGQRTVNGTGRTGFRLHLGNFNSCTENVFQTLRGPLIHVVGHRAGRSDRVNTRNFSKRIADMRRCVVAVHGLHFSCHSFSPFHFMFNRPAPSHHLDEPVGRTMNH